MDYRQWGHKRVRLKQHYRITQTTVILTEDVYNTNENKTGYKIVTLLRRQT